MDKVLTPPTGTIMDVLKEDERFRCVMVMMMMMMIRAIILTLLGVIHSYTVNLKLDHWSQI